MGDVRFAAREGSQATLVLMQQCCGMEDGRRKKGGKQFRIIDY